MGDEVKRCPDCVEAVLVEAEVCRYCGHAFEGGHVWAAKRRRRNWVIAAVAVVLMVGAAFSINAGMNNADQKAEDEISELCVQYAIDC
jgi:hypothetical protein